jgi:hypothetical protein
LFRLGCHSHTLPFRRGGSTVWPTAEPDMSLNQLRLLERLVCSSWAAH